MKHATGKIEQEQPALRCFISTGDERTLESEEPVLCEPSVRLDWSILDGKLYGRSKEERQLRYAYERIALATGKEFVPELTLVTGVSGSGKTALAGSLRPHVLAVGGFYVSGKFDKLQGPEKDLGVIQAAFTELVDQVFSRGTAAVSLKLELRGLLGTERMLLALIPAFSKLLDEDDSCFEEEYAVDQGGRTQERLFIGIRRMVKTICRADRPLVLFLDDLQWADPTSLDLLASLVLDTSVRGLMVLGACRGNEVAAEDYLSVTLRELEANNAHISEIHVDTLSVQTISRMISDVLNTEGKEKSLDLAHFLFRHTGGNAFFVLQYLGSMADKGLIFPIDSRDSASCQRWDWADEDYVADQIHCSDAVELLGEKLLKLPNDVQEVLMTASCFGANFEGSTLCKILAWNVPSALLIAKENGWIKATDTNDSYRFTHDQMQQSAYALIPEHGRDHVHLGIGRKLWELLDNDAESEPDLCVIANQVCYGAQLIIETEEQTNMAVLLLRAGEKSAAMSDFQRASSYLNMGIALLPGRYWRDLYQLTLDLFNAAVEIEYCTGNFARMEELIDVILKNTRTKMHSIRALTTKIYGLGSRNKMMEAVELGLSTLNDLGVRIPRRCGILRIMFELWRTKHTMSRFSDDEILNLPLLKDEAKLSALRIMSFLMVYTVMTKPMMFPVVVCRMVNLSVSCGTSSFSSIGFANYAGIICGVCGDVEDGKRLGRLAVKFVEKFRSKEWIARVYVVVYNFCLPCSEPFKDMTRPTLEAHRAGLAAGDIESAMIAASLYGLAAHEANLELSSLSSDLSAFESLMELHKQSSSKLFHKPNIYFASAMTGSSRDDTWSDLTRLLGEAKSAKNITAIGVVGLVQLKLAVYFQDYERGEEAVMLLDRSNVDSIPQAGRISMLFYSALLELMLCARQKSRYRGRMSRAKKRLKRLRNWEKYSPVNCSNKVLLLEAELNAVNGKHDRALDGLKSSIAWAERSEFHGETGLACELASSLLRRSTDAESISESITYRERAIRAYSKWGAAAKVEELVLCKP